MSHVSYSLADDSSTTAPFPVTYSISSTIALQSEILPRYDLGDQVTCIFLTRGVNDTYLVQTSLEKYILRIYRTGWRTLSDVLYEIDVLGHLDRKGIPVSKPVAQIDGSFVCTIQAPEGPRQIVLFSYAPGAPLNRHDATDSYYHGKAVATMHNAMDTFTTVHHRDPLDLTYLIDQSLQAIQSLHTCSSADWSYLQDLAERLRTQIQQFSKRGLDWGLCHGDCHMLNDHISEDHTITLFDFDCCAMGWRAYDLAILRWCEGFYKMDPGDVLWQAFLKGYTELRHVSETDLASIPAFVALREIWHTALFAWLQPGSGVQGFEKILQRTIRLLQDWESELLSL
jgi:Ser/Thr protein kinase RdoA (MazF antagonist)